MTHPEPQDPDTPAGPAGAPPAKREGDPLLAATQGQDEGTDGTRHGEDPGGRHPAP